MNLSRRDLMKAAGAAALAPRWPLWRLGAAEPKSNGPIAQRKLGKLGWKPTIYALGSAEIPPDAEAERAIAKMLDAGINYLDTAPSYQGTRSESVLGRVIKGRRDQLWLSTKTLARDADGAVAEVEASLKRLQTDRIDTLQIHAVNDFDTLKKVLGPGGAAEGLKRAQAKGMIRHIGITGHTRPEVILQAIKEFPFDSILVPVSALDKHLSDFMDETIPYAKKQGIAVVGMKALKGMEFATQGKFEAADLLRYAWSLPVDTLTIGLRRELEVDPNLQLAREFKPMPEAEMRRLEEAVKEHATTQHLWWKRR